MFCIFFSLCFSHCALSLKMGICDLSQIKRCSSDFGDYSFSLLFLIFGANLMLGINCCAPGPALLFWFILFIDILICFLLFVLHIMMQLWCWKLMIYLTSWSCSDLTSWCCSDDGSFHCFFVCFSCHEASLIMGMFCCAPGAALLCCWCV